MTQAAYPLSADPLTYGHLDILSRAVSIFDHVYLLIGNNSQKNYLFTLEERLDLAKKVLANFPKVTVLSFGGLLTDKLADLNINLVVRGLRNSRDYNYELNLYQNYLTKNPNLEFVNLFSSKNTISSTVVKELCQLGDDLQNLVPPQVKKALEKRIRGQTLLAITGEIGSGKSWLAGQLTQRIAATGRSSSSIDLDILGRQFLEAGTPSAQLVLSKIRDYFGEQVFEGEKLDRQKLAKIAFTQKEYIQFLSQLIHPQVFILLRQELVKSGGIIFIESATVAEDNLSYLTSNNLILVKSPLELRSKRLSERGLLKSEIDSRIKIQKTADEQLEILEKRFKKDGYGKIWVLENDTHDMEKKLDQLVGDIIKYDQFL